MTIRASTFRSSSILRVAARVRVPFPILLFLFWVTGSFWKKEKVKHFYEAVASPFLARNTCCILHCAIHVNKHIWQSENYRV